MRAIYKGKHCARDGMLTLYVRPCPLVVRTNGTINPICPTVSYGGTYE